MLKGDFVGWKFSLTDKNEQTVLTIDKKLENAGDILKEMFTTADNYFVKVGESPLIDRRLLFACPIIIDILHHEKSGGRRSRLRF